MKQQADRNRSRRQFAMGVMVYLKVQPYIQSSLVQRSNQKLSFRYFGPYKILARVGSVAYRLELPNDACIHPVVHVSQLKHHVDAAVEVSTELPESDGDTDQSIAPIQFLDSRMILKGATTVNQIRVAWSGMPSTFSTWEEINDHRRRYPSTPA
jgi:hypothetical protein